MSSKEKVPLTPYTGAPHVSHGSHSDSVRPLWYRTKRFKVAIILSITMYIVHANLDLFTFYGPIQDEWTIGGEDGRVSSAAKDSNLVEPAWKASKGSTVPRIAIIGAGAGGSSAAYFLSHFSSLRNESDPEAPRLETDVTLFERSEYVGGRSFPVRPWLDNPFEIPGEIGDGRDENEQDLDPPVECGASIFVAANKNLQKAAKVFNLTLTDHDGEPGNMAVWDGSSFVFTESRGWGWWDISKMFWRYGRAPLKVQAIVKTTVNSFLSLYSAPFVAQGAFNSIYDFSKATNLSQLVSSNARGYLVNRQKIAPLFVDELVAAASQVNYGTPVGKIHAVGALVSMAANGASQVVNGNRRIFEQFIARSGARVRFGKSAEVKEIVKLDPDEDGGRSRWLIKTSDSSRGGIFDAVILAAPFHQSDIKVVGSSKVASSIPKQAYVKLHVSFIITNASTPQPEFFGLAAKTKMPKSIFATRDTAARPYPLFNSLNYLQQLSSQAGARFGTESTWHVVKIFSDAELEEETLRKIFGSGNVARRWEKVFLAYPQLDPIRDPEQNLAPVRVDQGFYYVNGFERLISTMETETVSAFNVVSLMLKDFFDYTAPKSWAEWDEL